MSGSKWWTLGQNTVLSPPKSSSAGHMHLANHNATAIQIGPIRIILRWLILVVRLVIVAYSTSQPVLWVLVAVVIMSVLFKPTIPKAITAVDQASGTKMWWTRNCNLGQEI